ncbi:hypothetical protein OG592_18980 [Streptomyces avidinii]|uniref:hypothetical protein n=1 Tax=Streptomyces avidinii TaxID=1895 RepID=UPI003869BE5B|nr:hypothetical protein OG592_18980 [Streptomyces avidinii]
MTAASPLVPVVFRGLICAAAVVGLLIDCAYGSVPVVLSDFTIWTNILVAVVLGVSAARARQRRPDVAPSTAGCCSSS